MRIAGYNSEIVERNTLAYIGKHNVQICGYIFEHRIVNLYGVHMYYGFAAKLCNKFSLDAVYNIMHLKNVHCSGHFSVEGYHASARAVVVYNKVVYTYNLGM